MINFTYNSIAFVLIISFLVFIHEFGHYIVAKLNKVHVEVFSIGFGKKLFSRFDKSNTEWRFCLIPIGGYVKMYGDLDSTNISDKNQIKNLNDNEKKSSFYNKSLAVKSSIIAAGPMFNFLLSLIIFTSFYSFYGKVETLPIIDVVIEKGSASEAGLLVGDKIIKINDKKIIYFADIEDVIFQNQNKKLNFLIERDNEQLNKIIIPKLQKSKDSFGNEIQIARIGIASKQTKIIDCNIVKSLTTSIEDIYKIITKTLSAINNIIIGKGKAHDLSGPVSIAKYSGQSAKAGINTLFWFIAMLSINLGLMNLLPIPALDGGHLFFYGLESIIRKPISYKIKQSLTKIGLLFLVSLMIFSFYNDIIKIVTK